MTSRVVREGETHPYPGQLKEIIISCDQMDCNKSVNDQELKEGGGLKEMGWSIVPIADTVRHYCPEHPRDSEA